MECLSGRKAIFHQLTLIMLNVNHATITIFKVFCNFNKVSDQPEIEYGREFIYVYGYVPSSALANSF